MQRYTLWVVSRKDTDEKKVIIASFSCPHCQAQACKACVDKCEEEKHSAECKVYVKKKEEKCRACETLRDGPCHHEAAVLASMIQQEWFHADPSLYSFKQSGPVYPASNFNRDSNCFAKHKEALQQQLDNAAISQL